jgi:siroheme synthase
LAATGSTLVILMGVGRIRIIARRLMDGGLSATTPVAVVRWATTDEQHVLRTTLGDVADESLAAPSVIVVGAVASLDLRSHLATSFA